MNATAYKRRWSRFFLGAALFNYAIGVPMFFFKAWSYNVAFLPVVGRDPMAIRMWANFGFAVLLIGLGYQIISRDINKNRGIVLVGILAKLFDVVKLVAIVHLGFRPAARPDSRLHRRRLRRVFRDLLVLLSRRGQRSVIICGLTFKGSRILAVQGLGSVDKGRQNHGSHR